jgi:hypothetical protein
MIWEQQPIVRILSPIRLTYFPRPVHKIYESWPTSASRTMLRAGEDPFRFVRRKLRLNATAQQGASTYASPERSPRLLVRMQQELSRTLFHRTSVPGPRGRPYGLSPSGEDRRPLCGTRGTRRFPLVSGPCSSRGWLGPVTTTIHSPPQHSHSNAWANAPSTAPDHRTRTIFPAFSWFPARSL